MKKKIAVLALALTLCSAFAAFPVSALETENGTAATESVRTEEKAIYLSEAHLNKWLSLRGYVGETRKTMEFTTDSTFASIECNSIRIDKSITDRELYGDISEVIVECKLGTYKDLPEKRITLRFICEGNRSARTDIDSCNDTDVTDEGCCNAESEPNSSEMIDRSTLTEMSGKLFLISGSGVTVGTTIVSDNITAPSGSVHTGKNSADPVLSDRYNVDSKDIIAVRVPALSSEPRSFSLNLGNENVTPLLGGNPLNRGSLTIAPGSKFCIYNSNSDNAYDVPAKSS